MTMTGQDVRATQSLWRQPDVRTADMDFDKRIDIMQSLDSAPYRYRIWFNLGNQTYSPRVRVRRTRGYDFIRHDRCPDRRLQRRSGPGLGASIRCDVRSGRRAWVTADLRPAVSCRHSGRPARRFSSVASPAARTSTAMGCADLVLERAATGTLLVLDQPGQLHVRPAQSHHRHARRFSPGTAVRWADLNGNGTTDLIYADSRRRSARNANGGAGCNCSTAGLAPNLLTPYRQRHRQRHADRICAFHAIRPGGRCRGPALARPDAISRSRWSPPSPFSIRSGTNTSPASATTTATTIRWRNSFAGSRARRSRSTSATQLRPRW